MIYITLFLEFFKIGLFSIGGGLVSLPFLYDLVDKYGWITSQDLLDMIAIAESTPGPIGINAATFMGYKTAGILGGAIASLGMAAPSLIIIAIIVHYFMKFNENPLVRAGFDGIRPAVVGLIAAAGFQVAKISLFNFDLYKTTKDFSQLIDLKALVLFAVMLYGINRFKKHPIVYIAIAGFVGIIFKF
ncbi:chromate transporter [Alkaliphilus serpentinus]|uniref:Chromate transporter n=1 Tax=Alkaliphilus serpentinus TaxID=1482731 RepID=A0A833HPM0_9FIRM|nr:chromate transporter [Alkaliphilus serpentinus]KAB3531079.1 chromate transporter [Alkaliphilus serpentinus]